MAEIKYDFDIEGALQQDPFLDRYEIGLMFEQTRQSMGQALARKLQQITCDEHGTPPTITITGRYNAQTEEFDISYHVDTCCKMFMLRVIQILNNVN